MDRRFQWEQDPSEEPEARWRWHHWSNGQDVFLLTPKAVIKNILVDCDSREEKVRDMAQFESWYRAPEQADEPERKEYLQMICLWRISHQMQ